MSKSSAASKGYRKNVQKKPYLSKRDIIILCCIVVAVLVGIVLFNLLYDDGYLGAKEVQDGDVVSYAASSLKTRYSKLADAKELDGFTQECNTNDNNALRTYVYTPEDETSAINYISVSGSNVEASKLTDDVMNYYPEDTKTAKYTEEVQGHTAYVFGYTYSSTENAAEATDETAAADETAAPDEAAATDETAAADEAAAPTTYYQVITVYVEYDADHTIALHIYMTGDSDAFYLPEEEIVDYALGYTDAFAIVQPDVEKAA